MDLSLFGHQVCTFQILHLQIYWFSISVSRSRLLLLTIRSLYVCVHCINAQPNKYENTKINKKEKIYYKCNAQQKIMIILDFSMENIFCIHKQRETSDMEKRHTFSNKYKAMQWKAKKRKEEKKERRKKNEEI